LQKNENIKPPIIIEDSGLWNIEFLAPTMIDDYGLQKMKILYFLTSLTIPFAKVRILHSCCG
jgi:hypothetical protein